MMQRTNPNNESQHEKGMRAARERAEWELGDASWAGILVGAYLYPDADIDALRREQEPDDV